MTILIYQIGAGGTGSWFTRMLAYNLANIKYEDGGGADIEWVICDPDQIELKNQMRQPFMGADAVGEYKVIYNKRVADSIMAAGRVYCASKEVLPGVVVNITTSTNLVNNPDSILADANDRDLTLVVLAVDNTYTRSLFEKYFHDNRKRFFRESTRGRKTFYIDAGNTDKQWIVMALPAAAVPVNNYTNLTLPDSMISCADRAETTNVPQTTFMNAVSGAYQANIAAKYITDNDDEYIGEVTFSVDSNVTRLHATRDLKKYIEDVTGNKDIPMSYLKGEAPGRNTARIPNPTPTPILGVAPRVEGHYEEALERRIDGMLRDPAVREAMTALDTAAAQLIDEAIGQPAGGEPLIIERTYTVPPALEHVNFNYTVTGDGEGPRGDEIEGDDEPEVHTNMTAIQEDLNLLNTGAVHELVIGVNGVQVPNTTHDGLANHVDTVAHTIGEGYIIGPERHEQLVGLVNRVAAQIGEGVETIPVPTVNDEEDEAVPSPWHNYVGNLGRPPLNVNRITIDWAAAEREIREGPPANADEQPPDLEGEAQAEARESNAWVPLAQPTSTLPLTNVVNVTPALLQGVELLVNDLYNLADGVDNTGVGPVVDRFVDSYMQEDPSGNMREIVLGLVQSMDTRNLVEVGVLRTLLSTAVQARRHLQAQETPAVRVDTLVQTPANPLPDLLDVVAAIARSINTAQQVTEEIQAEIASLVNERRNIGRGAIRALISYMQHYLTVDGITPQIQNAFETAIFHRDFRERGVGQGATTYAAPAATTPDTIDPLPLIPNDMSDVLRSVITQIATEGMSNAERDGYIASMVSRFDIGLDNFNVIYNNLYDYLTEHFNAALTTIFPQVVESFRTAIAHRARDLQVAPNNNAVGINTN